MTPEQIRIEMQSIITRVKVIADAVYKIDKKAGEEIRRSVEGVTEYGIGIALKLPNLVTGLLIPFSAVFQAVKYQKLLAYYKELNSLQAVYNGYAVLLAQQTSPELVEEIRTQAAQTQNPIATVLTGGNQTPVITTPTGTSSGGLQLSPTNTPAPETGSNTTLYIVAGLALVAIGGVIWYTSSNK